MKAVVGELFESGGTNVWKKHAAKTAVIAGLRYASGRHIIEMVNDQLSNIFQTGICCITVSRFRGE